MTDDLDDLDKLMLTALNRQYVCRCGWRGHWSQMALDEDAEDACPECGALIVENAVPEDELPDEDDTIN